MLSACALLSVPFAASDGLVTADATLNGDFEQPFVPAPVLDALRGSVLDACFGIGHQVLYGSETVQGDLTGGPYFAPAPTETDPEGAVDRVTGDPEGEALFLAGYENCVWGEDVGYDLVWLAPVARLNNPLHWSFDPNSPGVQFGFFFDNDPFDREARFTPGAGSGHNMWQAYPSPHQAFSGNFEALVMDIEAGIIPPGALVQVSLTTVATEDIHSGPDTVGTPVLGIECGLNFRGWALAANQDASGHVSMSPTDAQLFARDTNGDDLVDAGDACYDAVQAFTGTTDEEERRDVLGRLRVVQVSFWSWNRGTGPVVVDNVNLAQATTFAEEALQLAS